MAAANDVETANAYAHPETLASTDWVAAHLDDPMMRLVEADEDVLLYDLSHIPGAVKLDWHAELQDPVERDFVSRKGFEDLVSRKGISNDTTVILYGDRSNWYATYAFWLFKLFGHQDARIMDGGRLKWEQEGRPWTRDSPELLATSYTAREPDLSIRAFRDEVFWQMEAGRPLVDVRSPPEYRGELVHMVDYPQEGAQRGGHIPGARNIPWSAAVDPHVGTFKSAAELHQIYIDQHHLDRKEPVIAYCRLGERSSHTWFVLMHLLGFAQVKNYDGSWTEWGNLVAAPIERDMLGTGGK
ncbi:MAG TPA: sulfurtransferase [Chloroflexota bacterium]|nr:sulfurtransferase [Chloroflexota bacterium]